MINKPSIENLLEKVDSVYTLVVLSAIRAKQINENADNLIPEEEYINEKPVTRSLQEIVQGKIKYKKNSENTLK